MSRSSPRATARGRAHEARVWSGLLVVCVLVMGASDAALLQLGNTYFSGGFNGLFVDTPLRKLGFFAAGLAPDAALVLGIWAFLIPLVKRLPGSRLQHFAFTALVTLAVPLLIDYVGYSLHYVLGNMVDPMLLWILSGRDSVEVASQMSAYVDPFVFVLLAASLVTIAALSLVARVEPRIARSGAHFAPPHTALLWLAFPASLLIGTAVLVGTSKASPQINYGLTRKASSEVLLQLINRMSDVDEDGYGLLASPSDTDPFDASVNPAALDIPGNGIDENGLAGDHPANFPAVSPIAAGPPNGSRRPQFLLIFLESFRADLLGTRLGDSEIMPFLNALARDGASSDRAFVNTPATFASRAQLFGGRLIPQAGKPTLIDDFHELGYTVAHFSGQDDSYGGSEPILGVARTDHFYDARQDIDRRISRTSSPVGLQVSCKLVNERVLAYLKTADPERPLFLYVNYTDTHFPYHHREIDDLLGIDPLDRSQINKDNAKRIWETYANTAANVDRAIAELVAAWKQHFGGSDLALLVTADHAQEIFERGFLGHSQSVYPEQSRVPFVLWRIGGEWPEPISLSDVRGLLRRHLFSDSPGSAPRARFVPDPKRRILQFVGPWALPMSIGLRGMDGATIYDVETGDVDSVGPDSQPVSVPADRLQSAFESLIWNWEGARLAVEGAR